MKKNLLTILLALLGSSSFGQNAAENSWIPVVSNQDAEISSQVVSCANSADGIDKNEVLLKVQNKTDQELRLTIEFALSYNENCYNCEGGSPEFQHILILPANESIQGECYQTGRKSLSFMHSFINIESDKRLTDFEVRIIETEKTK